MDEDFDWDARREQRLRQLGTRDPRCSGEGCEETDSFALTGVHPGALCYECLAARRGRRTTEDHHLAGRRNHQTTVSIPGNDHRILTAYQEAWPARTLRNSEHSPLLAAAGAIRGWLDVLRLIIERTVGWIPGYLEQLDAALGEVLGARWWDVLGLEPRA